jgi:hypothetical protein
LIWVEVTGVLPHGGGVIGGGALARLESRDLRLGAGSAGSQPERSWRCCLEAAGLGLSHVTCDVLLFGASPEPAERSFFTWTKTGSARVT